MEHGQNGVTVNVYKKKITQSGNLITSFTNVLDGDTLSISASNLTNGKFEATTYFHIAGSSSSNKVGINTSCSQSVEGQTFGAYTVIGFTDLNGNVCGTSSDCVDCNGVMNGGAVLDVCVRVHTNDTGWLTLATDTGIYDLLLLQNGVDTLLVPPQQIGTGKISQIRFILGDNNRVVVDSVSYPLALSSQDESGLKLNLHADIQAGQQYWIFRVSKSTDSL